MALNSYIVAALPTLFNNIVDNDTDMECVMW